MNGEAKPAAASFSKRGDAAWRLRRIYRIRRADHARRRVAAGGLRVRIAKLEIQVVIGARDEIAEVAGRRAPRHEILAARALRVAGLRGRAEIAADRADRAGHVGTVVVLGVDDPAEP